MIFVISKTKEKHARAKARRLMKAKLGRSCIAKSSIKTGLEVFGKNRRYNVHNDLQLDQQMLFKVEEKQFLRWLSSFAVVGHHAAMRAWCCMNQTEKEQVEVAIIALRVAASAKMCKYVEEAKIGAQRNDQEPSTRLR